MLPISLYKLVVLLRYFCGGVLHSDFLADQINGAPFTCYRAFYHVYLGPSALPIPKGLVLHSDGACNVYVHVTIRL